MIILSYTPQRSDLMEKYAIDNDILTVTIDGIEETFDFTGLAEGRAVKIEIEVLPANSIMDVEKINDTIFITAIRFYGKDEKSKFEVV